MFLSFYLKDLQLTKQKPKKIRKIARVIEYRFLRHWFHQITNGPLSRQSSYKRNFDVLQLLMFRGDYNRSDNFNVSSFWFFLYQQYYLSTLLRLPVQFKSFNSQHVVPRSLLYYMIHSVKLIKWKRYYITHSNEIIEVLFLSLWLKNLSLFMDWMRKYFEKTNLKKHRKLFLLLNLLLGKLVWNYNIFLQLKGLRLVLRGKFGKAGSVRKTRKYIRRGKCSYTTKKIGLVNQTNVIKTLTGVFSIKFEVFF